MVTKVTMTRQDLFKAGLLLNEHCKVVEGFAVYDEGWNDERVRKETGDHLNIDHIRKYRREAIGDLRPTRTSIDEFLPRIVGVEAQLKDLQSKYNDLIVKHNKLLDTLAVNKITDARHLKVA